MLSYMDFQLFLEHTKLELISYLSAWNTLSSVLQLQPEFISDLIIQVLAYLLRNVVHIHPNWSSHPVFFQMHDLSICTFKLRQYVPYLFTTIPVKYGIMLNT